jgi:hypothetical protein
VVAELDDVGAVESETLRCAPPLLLIVTPDPS